MRLVLALPLLAACRGCSAPEAPVATPVAAHPSPGATAPAATRTAYGLTLGQSDAPAIDAWLAAHHLSCTGEPAPRRQSVRYDCGVEAGLTPDTLAERPVKDGGKLTQVLLARGDATPLTHLSLTRTFSLPADAVTDYNAALAALTATYGAPLRTSGAPDPTKFGGPMAHWSADWRFTDLDVHVAVLKAGGTFITVSERYDVPGASAAEGARGPEHLEPTPGGDPFGFDKIPGLKKPDWHR